MIDREHEFIFIHIPKTGGTSIEKTIWSNHRDNSSYGWDNKHSIWKQHATIQQVQDLYDINIDNFFKFAIVRNPWDRAVSDYKWWTRPNSPFFDLLKSTTLEDYLLIRNGYEKINHLNNKNTGRGDHFIEQYKFIQIADKCCMNFIIKFENLQKDFDLLCDKIKITRCVLPHTNKTNRSHYVDYYNDKTKKIVAERYARDINFFNYRYGE